MVVGGGGAAAGGDSECNNKTVGTIGLARVLDEGYFSARGQSLNKNQLNAVVTWHQVLSHP